ncbi:BgMFReM [Biomphalaria glabrata]|uniref:Fibrinogen-like protein 1 n=1 Tax=Biomphalaria glabrata TaxID=6526 RepID=A0A9W2Z4R1_BIOGL|nr:fibrinogen-like protein 1 [Biomphalaria glabrata]KAI8738863.1 fibroleukin-like; partial [Biomphalaria glabrata]
MDLDYFHPALLLLLGGVSVLHVAKASPTSLTYFEKSLVCNASAAPYSMLTTQRHMECAFECADQDGCAAYLRVNDSACSFYNWSVLHNVGECGSSNAVRVYLKLTSSCKNGATMSSNGTCQCVDGYVGTYCQRLMEDCFDGYLNGGYRTDQKYWIKPLLASSAFKVYCQMSQGTGLTMIQLRTNANIDFNKTWQNYKVGFEVTEKDFWLGNDYIHWLTTSNSQILLVQLSSGKTRIYQYYYNGFKMANEAAKYAVTFENGWSNNVTDSKKNMTACWPGTSINFSTWDQDNDGNYLNCAQIYGAGFWFTSDSCTLCNPNGVIRPGENDRLNIPSENFWTPNLADWTPDMVVMLLFRKP